MFLSTVVPYLKLMRFNKPIGLFLLLWPTYWALYLASNGHPPLKLLVIFATGVVLMRAAGCIFNDMVDYRIDRQVKRTCKRPLALGTLTHQKACLLLVMLLFSAANLLWTLNKLTGYLALIAVLLTATYPYTKRFFVMPQLYLGITFSFNVLMVFSAVLNTIPPIGWIIFLANACWIMAYDTQYAMIDKVDDIKIGIYSTAIAWNHHSVAVTLLLQILFCGLMGSVGYHYALGWYYWIGWLLTIVLFLYQLFLMQRKTPYHYLKAFMNNQYVGGCIFMGIYLHYGFA
jgi:4-hydroxybenzoate polyprenyltransferase